MSPRRGHRRATGPGRGTPRELALLLAVVGALAAGTCLLGGLIGLILDPVAVVLGAVLIAFVAWFVSRVAESPGRHHVAVLATPEPQVPGLLADRRALQIETQLHGADRRRRVTVAAVQRLLIDIAEQRLRRRRRALDEELAHPGVLSPQLVAVLTADPPRPLTRRHLRTLIKELDAL